MYGVRFILEVLHLRQRVCGGKFLARTTTTRNSFRGRSGAPGVSRLSSLGILRTLSGSWTNLKASSTRITGLVGSRLLLRRLCASVLCPLGSHLLLDGRGFGFADVRFDIFVPRVSPQQPTPPRRPPQVCGARACPLSIAFPICKGSSSTRIDPTNLLTGPLS